MPRRSQRVTAILPISTIFAAALIASLLETTSATEAVHVPSGVGVQGGIACVIGAENMETAVALAEERGFVVQLLDADPAKAASAKERLAGEGLLGRGVFVGVLRGAKLPYADNLIDLLVAAGDTRIVEAEMTRVLAQARGRRHGLRRNHRFASLEDEGRFAEKLFRGRSVAHWFLGFRRGNGEGTRTRP